MLYSRRAIETPIENNLHICVGATEPDLLMTPFATISRKHSYLIALSSSGLLSPILSLPPLI